MGEGLPARSRLLETAGRFREGNQRARCGIGFLGIPLTAGLLAAMARERLVKVTLSEEELARHDELRPSGMSRPAFLRSLLLAIHLAGAIKEADRDLERRRREAPEQPPKPRRMDPATRRFLDDDAALDPSE
jgi:hypothetical protein